MAIKPLGTKHRALCLNLRPGAAVPLALLPLHLTLLLYIWILRVIQCDIPLAVSRAIALLPLKCAIMTEGQQDLRGNHRDPHLLCQAHGLSLNANEVDLS